MEIGKVVRTRFDDARVPDCGDFYDNYIALWKDVYSLDKGPKEWLTTRTRSIASGGGIVRTRDTLNMAKILCEELAGLLFNEEANIDITTTSGAKGALSGPVDMPDNEPDYAREEAEDPTKAYVERALQLNAFWLRFQKLIEQGLALGGAAIKLVHTGEEIELNYLQADKFIPVGWDNREVNEGVFIAQEKRDKFFYTLMEWHLIEDHALEGEPEPRPRRVIRYDLYRSGDAGTLGRTIPVKEIYPDLEPETIITENIRTFVYFTPNTANNADYALPLGISVFANALDTIRQLDIAFDSFGREFVLGKKRIIVPASAIREVPIPGIEGGEPARYFDASDEAYEALDTGDLEKLQIVDNTVNLRIDEHISAINALLNILCLQTGLTAGTFSFDVAQGIKTATEIISANSKTYKTIRSHQNLIREALESLVQAIVDYGRLYNDLPADTTYDLAIAFDDGIVTDRDADIANAIKLTASGLISRQRAMMDLHGWTERVAMEELAKIEAETRGQETELIETMGIE